MDKLKINGSTEFMGIKLPVIEGGFGENKKCISDKYVSKIHNQPNREIRRRINDNIKRFKKGYRLETCGRYPHVVNKYGVLKTSYHTGK